MYRNIVVHLFWSVFRSHWAHSYQRSSARHSRAQHSTAHTAHRIWIERLIPYTIPITCVQYIQTHIHARTHSHAPKHIAVSNAWSECVSFEVSVLRRISISVQWVDESVGYIRSLCGFTWNFYYTFAFVAVQCSFLNLVFNLVESSVKLFSIYFSWSLNKGRFECETKTTIKQNDENKQRPMKCYYFYIHTFFQI